jgi:hypothetical protein
MFDKPKGPQAPPASSPSAEAIPMVEYEVLIYTEEPTGQSQWVKVSAHNVQLDNGCLMFVRVINADEACSMTRLMPTIYAPGEWRRCKTDYQGFKKNQFAIH